MSTTFLGKPLGVIYTYNTTKETQMKFLEVLGLTFLVMLAIILVPLSLAIGLKILEVALGLLIATIALLIPLAILAVPFSLLFLFFRWVYRKLRQ